MLSYRILFTKLARMLYHACVSLSSAGFYSQLQMKYMYPKVQIVFMYNDYNALWLFDDVLRVIG